MSYLLYARNTKFKYTMNRTIYDHLSNFHLYSNSVKKYTNTVLIQNSLLNGVRNADYFSISVFLLNASPFHCYCPHKEDKKK